MLHGRVEYQLKSGGTAGVDWAAYARLVKVDGVVKMEFYQVYLVGVLALVACVLLMGCRILRRKGSEEHGRAASVRQGLVLQVVVVFASISTVKCFEGGFGSFWFLL